MRVWIIMLVLAVSGAAACDRGGERGAPAEGEEVPVDENLGTLRVLNRVNEPVGVYLDGQELFAVPPGSAYTFRNLPTREVTIYGVGRISRRHFELPRLMIEEGGEYEWTIEE